MLQICPSVYKSYHHEDNNVILKKKTNIKTILDPVPDPVLYLP